VNHAIPTPAAPSEDVTHGVHGDALVELRAHGQDVFDRVGCGNCHSGPAKTDSGAGNPTLDLNAPPLSSPAEAGVLLHDVGTCVTSGAFPDVAHADIDGHPRDACAFDTPQLRGLADSAPYFHDGSAASLSDVVPVMLRACAPPGESPPTLSDDETAALEEYLRGL
jgi:cytochrome c peroxidase